MTSRFHTFRAHRAGALAASFLICTLRHPCTHTCLCFSMFVSKPTLLPPSLFLRALLLSVLHRFVFVCVFALAACYML